MKRRGSQRGSLVRRGASWVIKYRRHIVLPDGALEYLRTSEVVGSAVGPEGLSMNNARIEADRIVDKANAVSAIPQQQATLRQFIDVRFQPEHVDALKKGGRDHYRTILKNHVLPAFGAAALKLHGSFARLNFGGVQ